MTPNRINQSIRGADVVAPIRARACHAFHTVTRGKTGRPVSGPRLMQRGAERC